MAEYCGVSFWHRIAMLCFVSVKCGRVEYCIGEVKYGAGDVRSREVTSRCGEAGQSNVSEM